MSEENQIDFEAIKTNYLNNIQDVAEKEAYTKNLDSVKDINSLMTGYVHAQRAMGTKVNLPNEKSSQEDWNKLYKQLGRPETPDGYEIETPDYKFDDDVLKRIKQDAHEAGLTKGQASKLISSIAKMSREAYEALQADEKAKVEQIKAERSKWDNLSTIETTLDTFLKQNAKTPEQYNKLKTRLDTDNDLMQFLYDVQAQNAPKDIGQMTANQAAKETPEEVVGRILSDKSNFNDYYRNGGRNLPPSVLSQLKEAMSKSNPNEVAKYIRP